MLDRSVALIGMMGAGKTTIGRLLAGRLERRFVDSDQEIETRTGMTVAQIFEAHGEKAFRDLEALVVKETLCRAELVVTGVAGGAVLREDTRDVLRDHARVVWLDAPIEILIERVTRRNIVRPLIKDDPDAVMRQLHELRRPIYAEVADDTVLSGDLPPARVVERIVEVLA